MLLMGGQWHFHLGRSEHRLALKLGKQMEKIGAARNDTELQVVGCGWQRCRIARSGSLLPLGPVRSDVMDCLIRVIASIVQRCSKIPMLCCSFNTR